MNIAKGFAIELGAWDGIKYSNVYNLITKGWGALMIEGDSEKCKELVKNMEPFENVFCCENFVSLEKEERLDSIFDDYFVEKDFDFLYHGSF